MHTCGLPVTVKHEFQVELAAAGLSDIVTEYVEIVVVEEDVDVVDVDVVFGWLYIVDVEDAVEVDVEVMGVDVEVIVGITVEVNVEVVEVDVLVEVVGQSDAGVAFCGFHDIPLVRYTSVLGAR